MSSRAKRIADPVAVTPFVWGGSHAARHTVVQGQIVAADPDAAARQAQLATLERDAFAKGFAQGERAGLEAASQRGEAMVRRLTGTLQELASLRTQMIRQTERQMVELALAVARRVLHREVSLDHDLLIAMARVALDRLGEAAQISVRLNPEDYELTGSARGTHLNASNVTVVADARIPRGGCRVESDLGILDAGVDAQIQELAQALLGTNREAGAAIVID